MLKIGDKVHLTWIRTNTEKKVFKGHDYNFDGHIGTVDMVYTGNKPHPEVGLHFDNTPCYSYGFEPRTTDRGMVYIRNHGNSEWYMVFKIPKTPML